MADLGILPDEPDTWGLHLPAFGSIQEKLREYTANPLNKQVTGAGHIADSSPA